MPRKYTPEEAISVFWSKVAIADEDDCWEWQGRRNSNGYGGYNSVFSFEQLSHRIAYRLIYGNFDRSLHVLHKCDNPPCCNPRHLFLGTDADNALDRTHKGRGGGHKIAGENQVHHKVTQAQVDEIRELYAKGGISQRELGEIYGISQTNVGFIVRGETWRS